MTSFLHRRGLVPSLTCSANRLRDALDPRSADGRPIAIVLATLAAAFLVAAVVKRSPPDFSALPVIAVVRDGAQRPLWAIRLAGAAHEIAVDSLGNAPLPTGGAYQLWLATPNGPRWLGLLPVSGRKVLAEIPALAVRLAERGELMISLDPAPGAGTPQPGPVLFRAAFSPAVSGSS
jgi:anti-sigma-K factor RskA